MLDELDKVRPLRLVVDNITPEELERLPKDQRAVLECFLAGNAYQKIAVDLDIPLGTVRSRLNRARSKIIVRRAKDAALSNS